MKMLLQGTLIACLMTIAMMANATEILDYLTDKDGKYVGPSVADNIAKMDTDNNGFADVYEVRAFLEKKHGVDYQKDVLDRWFVAASGQSCGTSFAKELSEN
jgi:hypothetical protein